MNKKVNIGIIQNKYTDLIIYRNIDKNCNLEIPINRIKELNITFTKNSTMFNTDHIYKFDTTNNTYVIAYEDFEAPINCSCYECVKTLEIEVDGHNAVFECKTEIQDITSMIAWLNSQANDKEISDYINFYQEGNRINIKLNPNIYPINSESYIKIVGGSLLKYLKWNKGTYRSTNIDWDNITDDKDFYFILYANDIEFFNKFPEGYLDIQLSICYIGDELTPECNHMEFDNWIEFTYKQTEIYRAKIFEYIANNFEKFTKVEQRFQTEFEKFMQYSIYFDSVYRAFKSALEVGNKEVTYELLLNLINYKKFRPLQ